MENFWLFLLLNLGVWAILYFFLHRKIDRKIESNKVLEKIRREINQVIVELNHTTERNIGLMEDKIRDIEAILQKAGRSVSILNKETDKYNRTRAVYSNLRPKSGSVKINTDPQPQQQEKSLAQEEQRKKPVKEQVLELFHMGIDSKLIASRVGKTIGEVELIISLEEGK